MPYVLAIMVGIAAAIAGIALSRRLDAERAIFGWALVIAAFWYIGFGVFHGQALSDLTPQLIAGAVFLALAVLGLTRSIAFTSAGWLLHVFWDYLGPYFGEVIAPWWVAPACLGFDVVVGVYLLARYRGVVAAARTRSGLIREGLIKTFPSAAQGCAAKFDGVSH